jgi:hypothetical protein
MSQYDYFYFSDRICSFTDVDSLVLDCSPFFLFSLSPLFSLCRLKGDKRAKEKGKTIVITKAKKDGTHTGNLIRVNPSDLPPEWLNRREINIPLVGPVLSMEHSFEDFLPCVTVIIHNALKLPKQNSYCKLSMWKDG